MLRLFQSNMSALIGNSGRNIGDIFRISLIIFSRVHLQLQSQSNRIRFKVATFNVQTLMGIGQQA